MSDADDFRNYLDERARLNTWLNETLNVSPTATQLDMLHNYMQSRVKRYRDAYETERRYRTLGGTPLKINEVEWENRKLETPEPGAPI